MRYFSFNDFKTDPSVDSFVETFSEKDILDEYWTYWYGRMCEKLGKEFVDANYTQEDCIQDWVIVNWAWEVDC